jgi:hypothetical protein
MPHTVTLHALPASRLRPPAEHRLRLLALTPPRRSSLSQAAAPRFYPSDSKRWPRVISTWRFDPRRRSALRLVLRRNAS